MGKEKTIGNVHVRKCGNVPYAGMCKVVGKIDYHGPSAMCYQVSPMLLKFVLCCETLVGFYLENTRGKRIKIHWPECYALIYFDPFLEWSLIFAKSFRFIVCRMLISRFRKFRALKFQSKWTSHLKYKGVKNGSFRTMKTLPSNAKLTLPSQWPLQLPP